MKGLKIVFWRPLSGLLIRIDHALFGDLTWPYHLHSLLWWIALLAAAGLLLRRILPGAVGLLAILIFTLDESHVLLAGWISNRNTIVAALPAVLRFLAHVRWRLDGW